jgi:Na+-driven multidrug efflux pump
LRKQDQKRYKAYSIKNLSIKVSLSISKLSLWSGIATMTLMAGIGLFNYIVGIIDQTNNSGNINASATSIILHIMMLIFMGSFAFGTATATLVAQSIGKKQYKLAKQYCWHSVILAIYAMSILAIISLIFPKKIISFFLPTEIDNNGLKEATITIALKSFKLVCMFLAPVAAAGLVLIQALYGAGKTRYIMILEFILHFFFFVPLTYFFSIYLKLNLLGCWIAAIAYAFALFICTAYKFSKGDWQKTII